MKTNKANSRNHTSKHTSACDELVRKWRNQRSATQLSERRDYYCVAKCIVQREGKAINKYFAFFFFQTIHAENASSGPWFTNYQCGETIVRRTMDAEINNVIHMELNSGPKIANSTCGKTIDVETIDRDSTVHIQLLCIDAYISEKISSSPTHVSVINIIFMISLSFL